MSGFASLGYNRGVFEPEPSAGSDARAIRAFARREGDEYVINGCKMWMSNGPLITVLIVVAKTETAGNGDAISMFIVPFKDMKGITVSKPTPLMTSAASFALRHSPKPKKWTLLPIRSLTP